MKEPYTAEHSVEKPQATIRVIVRLMMSPVFPVVIFLVFLTIATALRSGLV